MVAGGRRPVLWVLPRRTIRLWSGLFDGRHPSALPSGSPVRAWPSFLGPVVAPFRRGSSRIRDSRGPRQSVLATGRLAWTLGWLSRCAEGRCLRVLALGIDRFRWLVAQQTSYGEARGRSGDVAGVARGFGLAPALNPVGHL